MKSGRAIQFSYLLAACMLHSGNCAAAWQQSASARLSGEYDSNPAMSSTYAGDVSRYLLEPSYTLTGTFDRDELTAGLAFQISRSSNKILSPDRDSPSVFLEWLRQTDAGEFAFASRYAEISTRDAGLDAAGRVPVNSTRASRNLSGRWSNALSERSTLALDAAYESVFFSGGTYTNYATRTGGMRFSYVWNEHSTPFIRMSHTDYEQADDGPSSQLDSATAGLDWKASDTLEGTVQAGKSWVRDAETSTNGLVSVQHTGERTILMLSASRQLTPSGLGGFITVDQAIGNLSYDLNDLSRTGINLEWRKSHFITDIINRTAGVWLQHDLNTYWGLRTYYMRNMLGGDGINDAASNILGLALTYTHSDF